MMTLEGRFPHRFCDIRRTTSPASASLELCLASLHELYYLVVRYLPLVPSICGHCRSQNDKDTEVFDRWYEITLERLSRPRLHDVRDLYSVLYFGPSPSGNVERTALIVLMYLTG